MSLLLLLIFTIQTLTLLILVLKLLKTSLAQNYFILKMVKVKILQVVKLLSLQESERLLDFTAQLVLPHLMINLSISK